MTGIALVPSPDGNKQSKGREVSVSLFLSFSFSSLSYALTPHTGPLVMTGSHLGLRGPVFPNLCLESSTTMLCSQLHRDTWWCGQTWASGVSVSLFPNPGQPCLLQTQLGLGPDPTISRLPIPYQPPSPQIRTAGLQERRCPA